MSDLKSLLAIPPEKLRWKLDPQTLPFETTSELDPLQEIIGQDRALEAFRFGLGVRKEGYNVFVTGSTGTGRMTTVLKILQEMAGKEIIPDDLCYVYNFKNSESPRLLRFPAKMGRKFRDDVHSFVENLKKDVPMLFESEDYLTMKKEILEKYEEKGKQFFKDLDARVKEEGFAIVQVQIGQMTRPVVMPIVNDQPTPMEKLESIVERGEYPQEKYDAIKNKHHQLTEQVDRIFMEIRDMQREVQKQLEEMDRYVFQKSVTNPTDELKKKYDDEKVHAYLDEMTQDMADNLNAFRMGPQQPMMAGMALPIGQGNPFLPYSVNLLVDNGDTETQPIIVENYPNFKNLFGTIERVVDRTGIWTTDFSRIHAGSLLKANGGFLVINLLDAIMEPGVWQGLKRALKANCFEPQTFDPFYIFTTGGMTPEPIPLDLKVVVISNAYLYYLLNAYDEDTRKIFKVRADFANTMESTEETIRQVGRYIRLKTDEDGLKPFDRTAVAAIIEEAVRMTGRKEKISTHLLYIGELLVEADFRAQQEGIDIVSARHVEQAIRSRIYRSNLIEEQIQEMIDRGTLLIDTEGAVVGQINGLSVYMLGDYAFGKPTRITSVTSMGRGGVINIEREADLSGNTHNKGVLILSGYLRRKYAQKKPLSMTASLAFEQSYSGVDGDSASSTEIYAILSSLSGCPLRQDLAVTGSVNQKGEIQAIGGVNEKIEGFFDCCRAKKLTSTQGVLIPASNEQDLMLRADVIEAVARGEFSIYRVHTVDQGIELLTGIPAGEPDAEGVYPEGTIHARVHAKLDELAKGLKEFGEEEEEKKNNTKDKCQRC
ncbi:ATP-dependent Lon protease [Syntrophus gentianae]|uniref:endopeptidase La n=1 Tax=Syntrophus gentianae TaxID=43775 RepID=A0A1H7UNR3_9BACT|nr:ATP-binding protein [Syntrophus gentianae]SEL98692.1 ATP-dependent Lon protease [Syntrophus gentianae]